MTLPTYLVFSAPGLAAVAETADPVESLRKVASQTDAWVAVTLGARGVLWINDGVVEHTPAYTVTTVDTLGAGDVYHGAFALGIAEHRAIEEVVRRAAAAAALKCARFGGREGIPTRDDVEDFMRARHQ